MKNLFLALLLLSSSAFAITSGELDLGSGAGLTAGSSASLYPQPSQGFHAFDDFVAGTSNINLPVSTLGWTASGANGGLLLGGNGGTQPAGVAGRVGLVGLATGTTNSATGYADIGLNTFQMYAGQTALTMQWAAQMPASLSTAGVEYVIEMGYGVGFGGGVSVNALAIQYKRTVSTNFSGYSSNNSTVTTCTTADSADFVVTAGAWYNFKVTISADGTLASLYVAPSPGAFVLLCNITTNLPSVGFQANPLFQIYKASSTATSSSFNVDWVQIDSIFASPR
jgi:hypothetical protein